MRQFRLLRPFTNRLGYFHPVQKSPILVPKISYTPQQFCTRNSFNFSRFHRQFSTSHGFDPPVPGIQSEGDKFTMIYTCNVCDTRAAKIISKHAYENGVVLVRCPGCENLHLIADRLGWFEDDSWDVEQILKSKGENAKVVTGDNILELTEDDITGNNNKK